MTEKYDLKALKAALLKSDDHVIETQIFGAKAFYPPPESGGTAGKRRRHEGRHRQR